MIEVCEHNVLRRACSQCDDKERIAELEAELLTQKNRHQKALWQLREEIARLDKELALERKKVQEIQNHNNAMKEAICAKHGTEEFWALYGMTLIQLRKEQPDAKFVNTNVKVKEVQ